MDYIGEKCPVCEKIFTADDDIVVCPDCGTPHHRSCYAAEKKCANEEYHSTGRKWERMNETKIRFRICPVCRFTNSPDDRNCRRCGTEISDIRPVSENDQRERAEAPLQRRSRYRNRRGDHEVRRAGLRDIRPEKRDVKSIYRNGRDHE